MKTTLATIFAVLMFLTSPVGSRAESVDLAWDPNPSPNVFGYFLYWGTEPGIYSQFSIISADYSEDTVSGLLPGVTYYFAVSAFVLDPCERDDPRELRFTPTLCYLAGELSDEISYTVPVRPAVLEWKPWGLIWDPDLRNFDELVLTSTDGKNWSHVPSYWFIPIPDGRFFLPQYRYQDTWDLRRFILVRTPRT